jgi:hypothetical protein
MELEDCARSPPSFFTPVGGWYGLDWHRAAVNQPGRAAVQRYFTPTYPKIVLEVLGVLPIYKCSSCGVVFVEWTVGEERGTPWFFIQKAFRGEFATTIRATLLCPRCGENNGTVVWLAGSPLSVLNMNVKASVLAVMGLTSDDAQDSGKVAARAKEMYPNEEVVTFASVELSKQVNLVEEGNANPNEEEV